MGGTQTNLEAKGARNDLLHILQKRRNIINELCDGNVEKREVLERVDVSRPTMDRAYRELNEIGIINSVGTSHVFTRFGKTVCHSMKEIFELVEAMEQARDFLIQLPEDAPIDLRVFLRANIHFAEAHAPQEVFVNVLQDIDEVDSVRGYASAFLPSHVSLFYDLIMNTDITFELLFTESVLDTLHSNYPDQLSDITEKDTCTVRSTDADIPFGVILIDNSRVFVPLGDNRKQLIGIVENNTEYSVEWAKELLDRLEKGEDTVAIRHFLN